MSSAGRVSDDKSRSAPLSTRCVALSPIESGQYMSHNYREVCGSFGIVQSVGRTGSCHDCEHNRGVIRLTSDPCYDWPECLSIDLSA